MNWKLTPSSCWLLPQRLKSKCRSLVQGRGGKFCRVKNTATQLWRKRPAQLYNKQLCCCFVFTPRTIVIDIFYYFFLLWLDPGRCKDDHSRGVAFLRLRSDEQGSLKTFSLFFSSSSLCPTVFFRVFCGPVVSSGFTVEEWRLLSLLRPAASNSASFSLVVPTNFSLPLVFVSRTWAKSTANIFNSTFATYVYCSKRCCVGWV